MHSTKISLWVSKYVDIRIYLLASIFYILSSLFMVEKVAAAVPASWKATGFGINASGMTLSDVLQEFSTTYGVKLKNTMSTDAVLRGRFQGSNGSEFLDRLAAKYSFRWFVYNDTLYVGRSSDVTSMRIQVGEDAVLDSKAALTGLGLFDSRFGWGELPDEGAVLVSGPRQYVDLVRETLLPTGESKKNGITEKQLMVFRLKYASATDRTISTRGQADNIIPGVKSILSGLLNAQGSQGFSSPDDFSVGSDKRSRQGKSGRGGAKELTTSPRTGESSRTLLASARDYNTNPRNEDGDTDELKRSPRSKMPSVRIDADQSLNAIIIYDSGNKRAMYQALITELDIEPQQIEIEALIVDIDRSQLNQLGAEWGFNAGSVSATFNGMSTDSKGASLPVSGSTLLIKNAANFYARLNAMENKGDARILAKPTISTLENIAAVLDLSQSRYLPLVGERVVDLANVNVGTMLKVTPRIVREGPLTRVRLDINIEDGAFSADAASSTNVTRSTITTQAIIEPQHTLLIGGYHSEAKTQSRQKIPVLGDIPVIGGLFQNNADSINNRERLFLITPRISGLTGLQANRQSSLTEKARDILQADRASQLVPQSPSARQQTRAAVSPDPRVSAPQLPAPQLPATLSPSPSPAMQMAPSSASGTTRGPAPAQVLDTLTRAQVSQVLASNDMTPNVPQRTFAQSDEPSSVTPKETKKKKQQVLLLRYRQ
ncbi:type III secretion system outer membrane ring subunit SctC [Actimicrobium sp. CCC2.4]|uniref:type III secretion system outer membrane ring subunit SctC n=1 Tax=Actimicrobium sp. CCC2.4 TaxID=3048606 RepID=UPI002AC96CD7|nr:type III secretion system outer membrane ring subunit SctC [Actimicrobium sp. CCC2.4]MEB0134870.1 type III secretion system outer membrane ring subunit SctC [Actimicrobium sp. CCC2.4]WPX32076.1 type III secretion system outer membrane ring subunit SctC [Actimicrobium sp. CCC2.4]